MDTKKYAQWRKWEDELANGEYSRKAEEKPMTDAEVWGESYESLEKKSSVQKRSKISEGVATQKYGHKKEADTKRRLKQLSRSGERHQSMESAWGDLPEEEAWQADMETKYAGQVKAGSAQELSL